MRTDRLLTLAAFLDSLPPERFDFGHWVGDKWEGRPDLSCGTTACAAGWATTIPEFREAGLRMRASNWGGGFPVFKPYTGFTALGVFFDLGPDPYAAAARVFGDLSGLPDTATPKQVAAHIRKTVRHHVRWHPEDRP